MWCTSAQPASARRPETRWRFHLSRCPGFGVHFSLLKAQHGYSRHPTSDPRLEHTVLLGGLALFSVESVHDGRVDGFGAAEAEGRGHGVEAADQVRAHGKPHGGGVCAPNPRKSLPARESGIPVIPPSPARSRIKNFGAVLAKSVSVSLFASWF